ncbi:TPA: 50S ribosomal protein L25 [Candidatus Campbellbacteria bacterium]|nr:MAG: ribosomal 5S rRNA E-loop binding protein Ctc/L25/TL5, large subunit ribosomal protein L25 [Candidatus Campbellbacteria bacterium GW2011_OD1_34_28]KKP74631.1 MAG: 50S ribosomal protein L25 [Candidatus Campbellbacteria bacterium GW2011_GWD2_35_24]KKP76763.1 MAG: 50S ribosomal protein L25 [Candidatus Campbellbacteria bacterium GW2011_GWC1_35_31]KKP78666.1 MAG: 50S ribosomal protein L25 [Candidatus Campbellbacteria bacterium GW2011_GWD1_35_49]HAP74390.1 50S ribosomal protein L25 [Candidatus
MLTLNVKTRDSKNKLNEIRNGGEIPAVFYGREVKSTSISVSASEFKSVWKKGGNSSIINLKGLKDEREAVIHDMDIDPVSNQVRHIDFYIVKKGEKMETTVPLEFVGEAPAVKTLGGVLVKALRELNIEVLPKDLPQHIDVDISSLVDMDSQIAVKDLVLPTGVTVTDDAEEVVVLITHAEEEKESEPVDISSIEIEKKGKKEEEPAE